MGTFRVLFDEAHGQKHWGETGYGARSRHERFAGLAAMLEHVGAECDSLDRPLHQVDLREVDALVIPTPTGLYDREEERWRVDSKSLFRPEEIGTALEYVRSGGILIAFAYRFGDWFTRSNVGKLFLAFGCHLSDDAILPVDQLKEVDPLQLSFLATFGEAGGPEFKGQLQCRPMATFRLLPGSMARPLAYSPGGSCVAFDRTFRFVSTQCHPVGVGGMEGKGFFLFFGGPHFVEVGEFGLLERPGNGRYIQSLLNRIRQSMPQKPSGSKRRRNPACTHSRNPTSVDETETDSQEVIGYMEQLLVHRGSLRALGRWRGG